MKRTKKMLCVLLAVLMTLSVCGGLLTSAAGEYAFLVASENGSREIAPGAFYTPYTLSSGIYENTVVDASVLEFNTDDYVVMAYTGHVAGGVATLDEYYDMAVADGYEVVGMINGSFFTVATGIMDEYDVVNGILVCADAGNASKFDGMTVLYSDGTLTSVPKSELDITLSFNGVEAKNMLTAINKSGGTSASNWKDTFYYFDSYSGTMVGDDLSGKILTYEDCPGYEVVCKKETNSDLSIGGTLYGEVVDIRENRFGGEVAEDEFVLFMRADSSKASVIDGIAVGDQVSIKVEETVAGAYDVTKDAISVFENPSWLVKDGENLVEQDSYNSKGYWHNNVYKARWAVFGTKPDGSWAFLTSEGGSSGTSGSVTLQDVAKAMIELGCDNVIRMDGGGSVGMYVADAGDGEPGYVQSHSRNVVDCIMVVKRSSPALNGTAKNDLKDLVDSKASETSEAYKDALSYAQTVLETETSVSGDYLRAYRGILQVEKAYEALADAMARAEALDMNEYAPTAWELIQNLLEDAEALQTAADADLERLETVSAQLLNALASTGEYSENVALGKSYESTKAAASGYPDEGNKELTDGSTSNVTNYGAGGWSGYLQAGTFGITVDLGEEMDKLSTFSATVFKRSVDGIEPPKSVTVYVSTDGKDFTSVGTATKNDDFTVTLSKTVSARYVKFEFVSGGAWCFVSELEVIRTEQPYGAASQYARGDVDGDGIVHARDYMMLRRHILQLYTMSDEEYARGDVNLDGSVNARDYIELKRVILGTYEFPEE